ncbi:MAG TPA: hypothetical protein DCR55_13125 [Lentisphaeria bacterium]|nr:hypothetical protein [Lentisphaeria bacterium]
MKTQRCYSLGGLIAALLLFAAAVHAQGDVVAADAVATRSAEPVAPARGKTLQDTEVSSDSMDYDIEKRIAMFSGNVRIDDERVQLRADKMKIEFAINDDLKSIVAEGNVQIKQEDNLAKGKQAVYDYQSGIITLSGEPVLLRPQSKMSGAHYIIYDRAESKFRAQGGKPKIEFSGAGKAAGGGLLPTPEAGN